MSTSGRKTIYDNEIQGLIMNELKNDPLYEEIKLRDEATEKLFDKQFLEQLNEHSWYSTRDSSEILDLAPSTVRYYIQQLEEYVLPPDAPVTKGIRLNYISIVKLKMIFLLKDEFKVAGLQTITGVKPSVEGRTNSDEKSVSTSYSNDLGDKQVRSVLNQILKTGLFSYEQEDDEDYPQIKMNKDLARKLEILDSLGDSPEEVKKNISVLKQIPDNTQSVHKAMDEHKQKLDRNMEEQISSLKKSISEDNNQKLQEFEKKMTEHEETRMSWETHLRLRRKALEKWDSQGLFKRLFAPETDKEEFIAREIKKMDEEERKESLED